MFCQRYVSICASIKFCDLLGNPGLITSLTSPLLSQQQQQPSVRPHFASKQQAPLRTAPAPVVSAATMPPPFRPQTCLAPYLSRYAAPPPPAPPPPYSSFPPTPQVRFRSLLVSLDLLVRVQLVVENHKACIGCVEALEWDD